MAITQKEAVDYWIAKSKDDLKAARVLFDSKLYLHSGFMCQQCIEKALKAYYIHTKDERHPRQHNVVVLAEIAGLFDSLDDSKKQTLSKLVPLYIETRYEDEKNAIAQRLNKSYCKNLLSETEVLLEWIIQSMK